MSDVDAAPLAARHLPGCAGTFAPFFATTDRNRRVSDRVFHYVRCDTCGLILLADPPAELGPYYTDEYYSIPTAQELARLGRKLRYQVALVLRYVQPGRLVEIGPRWGVFSRAAQAAGFEVTAIEMDPTCCEHMRETAGIDARCSDRPVDVLHELPPSRAIAMWHVVEHLEEPWSCLDAAARNLEPGGVLVIATPNPQALGLKIMRGRWTHIDAPRHLQLVPARALERRLAGSGLALELVTARDRSARSLSRSAWTRLLAGDHRGKVERVIARAGGTALWGLGALPESVGLAGAAYTAIFRREG